MQPHSWVIIVTCLSLILYFWMGLNVGGARRKTGIAAPAMTGDPLLERTVRVQANTLEWLIIYVPSLWMFAFLWSDLVAAIAGVVWIVGRFVYAVSYVRDPSKRAIGFLIQFLATAFLLFGALGRAVWVLLQAGA